MTKSDEIELLKRFAEKLPEHGYVATFLRHLLPQFELDVQSDFYTFINVREMEQEAQQHKEALKDLQKSCDARVAEIRRHDLTVQNLAAQKQRYLHELDEIRKKLANIVGSA